MRPGDRRSVTARVYRRRRIAVGTAVLLVLATLIFGVTALTGDSDPVGSARSGPAAPTPMLPALPEPGPVLQAEAGTEPVPDPALLAGVLAAELSDPRLGGRVSGRIVDVATGEVLFDQSADRAVTPASTAKLATALAAELAVRPGLRLSTTVRAGARPGEIVLVGGGDPTLSSAAEGNVYPGAATMADLAAQVSAAAAEPISSVLVDSTLFSGPLTGPGWGADDAPSRYAAPITATMVDGGRLGPQDEGTRSGEPDLAAGRALASALGVPDVPVSAGTAPPAAALLGEVFSAPIERLVEQTLSLSDNVLAEAMARQVALAADQPASFAGAAAAVRSTLQQAGYDMSTAVLVDGSGLSVRNRLSPALLSDILAGAAGDPATPGRALLAGLPVAGYDGTLTERFDDSPAHGLVRAKTGTLNGVSALAGVVETADGRLLVFALMADEVPPGGRYPAEAALDEAATAVAGCGCR